MQHNPELRKKILAVEEIVSHLPNAVFGDAFPLKHSFGEGLYVREMFVPAGNLIVTKIHKFSHPYFLMKGVCSVLTESGSVKIEAPFTGITPAGTKRVVYTHTDTWWITVHATRETDIDKIEDEVIAKSFDEVDGIEIEAFVKQIERGEPCG